MIRSPIVRCLAASTVVAFTAVPARPVEASAVEGRWKAEDSGLIVDIGRCGARYCGQLVKAADQCGGTMLTVELKETDQDGNLTFEGPMKLPDESRNLTARIFLAKEQPANRPPTLSITGSDPKAGFETRSLPFAAVLARTGAATCRAGVVG